MTLEEKLKKISELRRQLAELATKSNDAARAEKEDLRRSLDLCYVGHRERIHRLEAETREKRLALREELDRVSSLPVEDTPIEQ